MLKVARISVMVLLAAALLAAGCTESTNTPAVTVTPSSTAASPSIAPTVQATATPTPIANLISTRLVPVKTSSLLSYLNISVYEDKVVINYDSGKGNLSVDSANMGGSGEHSGSLGAPGDSITLAYDLNMPRELPGEDAVIKIYQTPSSDSGVVYGLTKFYPRTGKYEES